MKKLVLLLIAALSVALTSCSALDSKPIEPNIIGTGNVHYEMETGTWFVVVDSVPYTIAGVTIPDKSARTLGVTQRIEPIEGMTVTIFTSERTRGIQAAGGELSAKQIEEMYKTNSSFLFISFAVIALCIIGVVSLKKNQA